jgi:hypothetical protein
VTPKHVMYRQVQWPFPDDEFPDELGALVMRSILDEGVPVLQVVHFPDNSWAVADGVHDPNEPGACIATHLRHVLERDPTVGELATLPIGSQADRAAVEERWLVSPFSWAEPTSDVTPHGF